MAVGTSHGARAGRAGFPFEDRAARAGQEYDSATWETRGPVALWLSTLLDDPSLGLEVVAGRAGIDVRGPIRWAHISDTPDPTPWLEGGELLLTTGLGVKDSPRLQERLVEALAARRVVAIGFGVGVSLSEVPAAMLRAADEHALPLFTVPYEVPFIAVTRHVARHTFDEHYATLRSAVDLHRRLLATVLAERGVGGVLATVGTAMPRAGLIVFDYLGRELGRHDPAGLIGDDTAGLWMVASAGDHEPGPDDPIVTSAVVRFGSEVEAVVVAVTEDPLLEHERLLFEQGVTGISLELSRGQSMREATRARADELLEEVVAGRSTRSSVERALMRLGAPVGASFQVLAVAASPGMHTSRLCTVVEDALLPLGRPVVGSLDDVVHAIVAVDATSNAAGDAAERVVDALRSRGVAHPRVGRSRSKSDLDALRAALREAHVALGFDTSTPVRDIDQLGLRGLIAGMRDELGADDFVRQVLGPVLDHDANESTHLVESLHAYLAHGCRPGPAAEQLCVHRHTLAYRLERIRDLTGRDPRSGEHLLEFALALELHERARGSA